MFSLVLLGALPSWAGPAAPIDGPSPPVAEPVTVWPSPADASGPDNWSATAEYVLWWLRRGQAPPIVTTSSPASQGLLGRPDTQVVYGDQGLETRHGDRFNGGRFALEWDHPDGLFGIEGRGFILERDSTNFALKDQSSLLALSYVDALTGAQRSAVFAGPSAVLGPLSGNFVGYSRVELFGEEVNLVAPLARQEDWRLDLLAGARFLQMRDRFHETATSLSLPAQNVLFSVMDNIQAHTAFYGGQLGLRGEYLVGRLSFQARGTIALGADDDLVRTYGTSIFQTPLVRIEAQRGLYVQPSNTGSFSRARFDAAGEVNVNVGYQLTQRLRAFVGYTFLGWADPLRAVAQVDRVVNLQATGPPRPTVPFNGDAFWAQGINLGLEVRW
jgi:hypothetical protein